MRRGITVISGPSLIETEMENANTQFRFAEYSMFPLSGLIKDINLLELLRNEREYDVCYKFAVYPEFVFL